MKFTERLRKRIASSGYTSRRKAEELILAGRVRVNDEIINTLGYKVSDKDKVYIDDELLGKDNKVYYLLNKPRGVVCTTDDDKNRTIITSLIDTDVRIFPVGRLDYDTTGAIILTNDGEFANLLTSPSSNVLKTYVAKIKGSLTPDKLFRLRDGVIIDGIKTKKAKVKVKRYDKNTDTSIVYITITEGKYHQVKRMFLEVGNEVLKLKRESIGFLNINNLASKEYRMLTPKEVRQMYSLAKNGKK